MDQSAVCSDWKSYINKCSEYVGQGNKKSVIVIKRIFDKDFESAVCAVEVVDVFINKILLFMVCICLNSQDCCWDYYIQKLS